MNEVVHPLHRISPLRIKWSFVFWAIEHELNFCYRLNHLPKLQLLKLLRKIILNKQHFCKSTDYITIWKWPWNNKLYPKRYKSVNLTETTDFDTKRYRLYNINTLCPPTSS